MAARSVVRALASANGTSVIEATHSALETRRQAQFHLSDQELLIRNFHKVVRDTVAAHQADLAAEEGR